MERTKQSPVGGAPEVALERTLGRRWASPVVLLATFVTLAASGAPSPLYVEYQHQWQFSPTILTTIYAVYAIGVVVSLLTLGGVSDRIGRRPVLILSFVLLLASLVLFCFAQNIEWLYAARAVQGLATGVFSSMAAAAITELQARQNRGNAALYNSAVQSIGIAVGAFLSSGAVEWHLNPLQTPFEVLLLIGVLVLAGLIALVPETAGGIHKVSLSELFRFQRLSVPLECRSEFIVSALVVTVAWSVAGIYLSLGGNIARELFHTDSAWLSALMIITMQGFGGLVSLAFRSVGNHRTTVVSLVSLLLGLAIVSTGAGVGSAAIFLGGNLITGIGFGLGFMSSTRRVTLAAPASVRGQVLAAYFVVAYLAISVPTIVAAKVAEVFGFKASFLGICAVLMAVALATLLGVERLDRRNRIEQPAEPENQLAASVVSSSD